MRPHRVLLLVFLTVFASVALAHHSWSQYDQTQRLELTGAVGELFYFNPHVTLTLDSGGHNWLVVMGSPYRMQKLGLTTAALKPGTKITVIGYPHRTDEDSMRAERIVLEGRSVEIK